MAGPDDTRGAADSQADGASSGAAAASPAPSPRKGSDDHAFSVSVAWSGSADGCGTARLPQGDVTIAIGGATVLGGCGTGSNPEELLFAAIGSCFINTWAIFLEKLKLTYAQPALRVEGTVGKDPAGGYRVTAVAIRARVPSALLAQNRAGVQKSLELAEKYCIVSRAARGSVPIRVEIEEV